MTEENFNIARHVDGLHNVSQLAEPKQRKKHNKHAQRKKHRDENSDQLSQDQQNNEEKNQEDLDDSIGIDYHA